jgi:hypothetical protein
MDGFVIDRSDGRDDGEDWTENYEELPGNASISIILESTTKAGVGPRLHQHPYAETFIIRRGSATFPSDPTSWRAAPDRSWWCPPTPRTSSRPARTATRVFTFTPIPDS